MALPPSAELGLEDPIFFLKRKSIISQRHYFPGQP
jgi:hypothetical protein